MASEVLVFASDPAAAKASVAAAGGRVVHVLTSNLLVISLPDDVNIDEVRYVSKQLPDTLERRERQIADAWTSRLGAVSNPTERIAAAAAAPLIAWDTPGKSPPHERVADVDDSLFAAAALPVMLARPTSSYLRGSVTVGVVIVGGPQEAPPWVPVAGSLRYVSVGADGTVWGVNAVDRIFRSDNPGDWTQVDGALKQISVGDHDTVWGVNAADSIFRWNGASWTRVSGELKHVSVGADGTVWGVNADDEVFRRDGDSWTQIRGELKQISVANENVVWGVNADDEIFRRDGDSWTQIPGELKHISVANDGSVWGVNADDEIFQRSGDGWEQMPGRLKQVSVSSSTLAWGVNSSDRIYTHDPSLGMSFTPTEEAHIIAEVLDGLAFLASAEPSANVSFVYDWQFPRVDVAPGSGNSKEDFEAPWRNAALALMGYTPSVLGLYEYINALRDNNNGTDWAYAAFFTKYPLYHFAYANQRNWTVIDPRNDGWGPGQINAVFAHETCHVFGAADEYEDCNCDESGYFDIPNLNCIECTDIQYSCLMRGATLTLCPWTREQIGWRTWEDVTGALKYVSVAADATVWGVNAEDEIYRWDGDSWDQIPGRLMQISVGDSGTIWGVNSSYRIFHRDGDHWTRVSGALKHVSVGADGAVWGVNADDKIFRRDGDHWTQISGALRQISVGNSDLIVGVNASGDVFQRDNNNNMWTNLGGSLKHVTIAADGTLWGVNVEDEIYRRSGNDWQRVPGALKQVSVGGVSLVWGVNRNDHIFRRK
jgi:hypothetical protein